MTKSNRRPRFELLQWEDPNGVSPVGLPRRHEHWRYVGYVYVFQFSNGLIKVGRTANPAKRIAQHLKQAGPFELKITKLWLSIAHCDSANVERTLLGHAREYSSKQVHDEYFKGLDFEAMVKFSRKAKFEPIDEKELAERVRKSREEPSIFGRPAPPPPQQAAPRSLYDQMENVISRLFGKAPDGSYSWLKAPLSKDSSAAEAEDVWQTLCRMADNKGCCLECFLHKTPIDLMEEVIIMAVRLEALRFENYAREHGHHDMATPYWDLIQRVLPPDDPRFDTERDPATDFWEYRPLVGYALCTKQGDVLDIADELPPGVEVGVPRGEDDFGSLRKPRAVRHEA